MRGLGWKTAHARSVVAAIGVLDVGIGTEGTAPARLAAPWAIMIHGSLVEKPITPSPNDVMLATVKARVVENDGLALLAKHGVPVRVMR